MNVILIYPEFPDTFWSFKHALEFIRKKSSSPPLGLLTIAAMLPKEWNIRLIDVNVQKLTRKDLRWADYAFISAMTVQRYSAHTIIDQCKEFGIKVVAGGPLFIYEYEDFKNVDHFILNEAEITLPLFLRDLEQHSAERIYQSTEFADLEYTPIPDWKLVNMKQYASMNVQYSRGCPFNCDFCNITALFGHKPRIKSTEKMIAELDGLYNAGWHGSIFFVDDNFIGNKKVLKEELLPALIQWKKDKKGIVFNTEVSINIADDQELMALMVAAGFTKVFIGIETTDENSLVECNKKHNLNRDLLENVKLLHRSGLQVQGGFIVGFDHDTPLTFQKIFNFIQQSGIVTAMVGILQAPPGTKLFDRMSRSGRIDHMMSGDNVDGSTNLVTKMDVDILKTEYSGLLNHLYSPEQYYRRVKTFLQEYKLPKVKWNMNFQFITENLMAFLRSIIKLGIFSKERLYYWKLFFWTLFHKPRSFAQAITFSIYGYHFRKICELHVV
ncbi:MAG TPA: B12-binding domain-containing radical SAM protein [Anaerolineaceae bacterium]|nr:B12-binding domain-containing radical SAM protein [Anaerolineaceae bacterium]